LCNASADAHDGTNLARAASCADEKQQMVSHFNEYAAWNNLLVSRHSGDVVLIGADCRDDLDGGAGADRFVFRPGEAGIDVVTDFADDDKVNLSTFAEAILNVGGEDAAKIVGDFSFDHLPS
jgi:Ca2+-binding RTX toxin-like protein